MKNNNHSLIKRVLGCIYPYKWGILSSLLCGVITVLLTLYTPVLIGQAVDCIISPYEVDLQEMWSIFKQMILVIFLTSLTQWLMSHMNNQITYRIVKDIRTEAFNKLEELPLKYIDSHSHGDIISRMISDIDQFSEGLFMGFTQLFTGVLTIIGTLVFMFYINVGIGAVVVVVTPVSLLVASFIAKKTYHMFQMQSKTRGDLTSIVNEMVGNQKVVQAFHHEKEAQETFERVNENLRIWSLKATFFSSITNPSTRFVNSLVYAAVGIFGALATIQGHLTVGQLTSFLSYSNQYTKPFHDISGVITEFQNALASAARVFELIDEEAQLPDEIDARSFIDTKGEIALDHVYFSYDVERPLIQNMNLFLKQGKRVALVGPTGCGKSTVINLLMRFYEVNSGSIKVDGTDIRKITRESLRTNYGMVLQDTWLKSGTIKGNIAYGKPDATEEEIIQAAKDARAHSFIERMPNGYDTVITEDGENLSQGQKQLLCIARVMLCLPPMLILDEATSSIDTRTERKIQKAFDKMMEGRTSVIVAHRLSTIQEADVILVMKDGRIIEQGTHEELLSNNGFYTKLYNSQFAPT